MSNRWTKHLAAATALLLFPAVAAADWQMNLRVPDTALGEQIYDLHNIITGICFVIFIGVFGMLFYSVIKHRKSKGHQAAQFHENTTVEVIWTIVPAVILIVMAVPATHALINMRDTAAPDLTIKATGYQWKWGYDYLKGEGEGIQFFSTLATPREQIDGTDPAARENNPNYLLEVDNPLIVPIGKKVRVLTTSQDVIHAWWVPQLAVKQDAIPGYIRDTWFRVEKPGTFRGQCAELCGKDHGFMPIVVKAVEPEKYTAWVEAQKKMIAAAKPAPAPASPAPQASAPAAPAAAPKKWNKADLISHGEKVFTQNCAACHQANGKGVPGTFPALAGSKTVNGPKDAHIATVLHGRPGTAMASFARLSDEDLAAVITYERNSWNNNAGVVMPADIKAARK